MTPNLNRSSDPSGFQQKGRSSGHTEKFELLSAYLDNEVSEQDRHRVEQWLRSDPTLLQHYERQLALKQAIQQLGPNLFSESSGVSSLLSPGLSDLPLN